MTPRWLWLPLLACLHVWPQAAAAQLVSPGKLAAAHRDLQGIRKCTTCHVLGERGVSNDKCLECHEPLRSRVSAERGFHATVAGRSCTECHKDHFGEDFDLVRFEPDSFNHTTAGFELVEAHGGIECRDCHQQRLISDPAVRDFKGAPGALDRTFLGLGTTCVACHTADDPHERQFAERGCEECHTQTAWDGAERFDHNRSRYRLTGLHRRVECAECHDSGTRSWRGGGARYVRYAGLRYSSCTSCHEDVHRGKMEGTCEDCHNTGGWQLLDRATFEDRFDHRATEFPLLGKHAEISCGSCHDPSRPEPEGVLLRFDAATRRSAYPHPAAGDCLSCHLDFHESVFRESAAGAVCESCHTQSAWLPTTYDIRRHNDGSTYSLTGAHLAIPCHDCHAGAAAGNMALQFRFESTECEACHSSGDPHMGQFAARLCTSCHETDSFVIPSFDHSNTRYPLDGAHRDVPCNDCHALSRDAMGREYRIYRPVGTECEDCHGGAS